MAPRLLAAAIALVLSPFVGLLAFVLPAATGSDLERISLAAEGPSLHELDRALALADGYLRSLYRPLSSGFAANSEYYGFPLRIHLQPSDAWLLLGSEDGQASVSATESGYDWEHFSVSINVPDGDLAATLDVIVHWNEEPESFLVTVTPLSFSNPRITASLFLNDTPLGIASTNTLRQRQDASVPKPDRAVLRSLRYTVRHSTLLAIQYYQYIGDAKRMAALMTFAHQQGFSPGADLYAPLWGHAEYASDAFFEPKILYHDCDLTIPDTEATYVYHSKVCTISRELYIRLTTADTLVPALQALVVLEQQLNASALFRSAPLGLVVPPGGDLRVEQPELSTPIRTAARLEELYRSSGLGMPRCLPGYCEKSRGSAVRTAAFGALEALLGYRYADVVSRSYADGVAQRIVSEQVGEDSVVRTSIGNYYRPALRGTVIASWDVTGRADVTPSLFGEVSDRFGMEDEYRGIAVSNAETNLASYAFLAQYRCLKYSVGCAGLGEPHTMVVP